MKITDNNISLVIRALHFAARKHKDQRRKGGKASPYINHLVDVAEKLWEIGKVRDFNSIAAGILHDTIEDTGTTREELESEFNSDICSIVLEVTDDKSLPKQVRRRLQIEHAGDLSFEARLVKLADKISNIEDIMDSPPTGWTPGEQLEYVVWAEKVIDRIRGTNEHLERYFNELCRKAKQKIEEADRAG